MVKLVTRAHTHTELRDEEEAGTVEQVRLATGLMNHSCESDEPQLRASDCEQLPRPADREDPEAAGGGGRGL